MKSEKSTNVYLQAFVSELNSRYGFKDSELNQADWVCKHTKIKGVAYNFHDHEFQKQIMADESRNIVVKKCAQVGLSEVMVRSALAFLARNQALTAILTQPTRKNALDFSTTRVDDVISDSKLLKSMLDTHVDSKELKKLGKSYLYIKGTIGAKTAISVPADILIHDELDFSDLDIINKYSSRVQHSKWKLFRKFSTPTIPKFGISKEFELSDQKFFLKKCPHCGKWNETSDSFDNDIIVDHPKLKNFALKELTKDDLTYLHPSDVKYLCQGCRKPLDYHSYSAREWVAKYEGRAVAGYQVNPFDTAFQTPYDLLKGMTDYSSYSDFVNFALGKEYVSNDMMFDTDSKFIPYDLGEPKGFSLCMGIDFGKTCWLTLGRVSPDNSVLIYKRESVSEDLIKERVMEYQRKYLINVLVCDALPQTKLSKDICEIFDGPAFTCYYSDNQKDLYNIKANEVDLIVNRTQLFDSVLGIEKLVVNTSLDKNMDKESDNRSVPLDIYKSHLRGMVKQRQKDDEDKYRYVKVDSDHLLHSLGYMYIASKILIDTEGHIAPVTFDTTIMQ